VNVSSDEAWYPCNWRHLEDRVVLFLNCDLCFYLIPNKVAYEKKYKQNLKQDKKH
jgi:hypothetical protein